MTDLASFLKSCEQSGRLDSEGAFTLGAQARLEGIQQAVSAEPGNFALKILQGLVGSGAQRINCQITRSEFKFEAVGCQHPRQGLLSRFSTDIGDQRDPTDDLAYGVLGALGVGLWEVDWQLSGGESVVMRKDGSQTMAASNDDEQTVFRFKFQNPWFTQSTKVRASAQHLLGSRCVYSPVPVTIDSRQLEPAALGGWYKSKSSIVGHREIIMNNRPITNPITAVVSYRYWGRLDVDDRSEHRGYEPPATGERVQSFSDGSKNNLTTLHDTRYEVFLLVATLPPEMAPANPPGETTTLAPLRGTIFLLADLKCRGGACLPIHRGVLLRQPSLGLEHPRAVALFDASGLDLDASTLAIAENQRFEQRLAELGRHTAHLVAEVLKRRSLLPDGAVESFDQLSLAKAPVEP
jgi:hypothetical protein